jgi:polyhydroxyalkanoate synthase
MKSTRRPKRRGSQTGARPRRRHGFPGANAPSERAAKHASETVKSERVELPGSDGFAPADGGQPELDHAAANQAAEEILGANPLIGFDRAELFDALGRLVRLLALDPAMLVREQINLARELLGVITGRSQQQADPKDRRFSHEIWQKNGYYKRLMQGFLAWRESTTRMLERANASTEDRERARFALSLVTEAFAPTNSLLGNPGALMRISQTRGKSLLFGLRNFVDDVLNNGGMPRQVDDRKFQVGKNLATTPGAVVFRSEVFELIQYLPATAEIYRRPLLIVPPQINKFYALDLSPGRSFAEYATRNGVPTFTISWRNPTAAQRAWNLETYLTACKDAIGVVSEVSGSAEVNTMAACAGGFTLATLLGHLAASGDERVRSVTLLVTVLDTESPTLLGTFASRTGISAAIQRSQYKGVLEGSDMARAFAWLRPNDLIWMFVANNWVMGNRPPAFDILYWNSDTTRLPAQFHTDLLKIYLENPLLKANTLEALGTPIDMSQTNLDSYVVAGITDHITPWPACYESRKVLRGPMTFVLSSSGHIQSIVNPPGNPKAKYFLNSDLTVTADQWIENATAHPGSWWDHWLKWYDVRGGGKRPAPSHLGSGSHPAGDPAPGRYVHQH